MFSNKIISIDEIIVCKDGLVIKIEVENKKTISFGLKMNQRKKWYPDEFILLVAKHMYDKRKMLNIRRCPAENLLEGLSKIYDENAFINLVYKNFYQLLTTEKKSNAVGERGGFKLYPTRSESNLNKRLIKKISFRKEFAKIFFRNCHIENEEMGGKKIDTALYWFGDYKKTVVELQKNRSIKEYGIILLDEKIKQEKIKIEIKNDFHKEKYTPLPPKLYVNHPHISYKGFTGRDDEKRILNLWLDNSNKSMLTLIGIGGMGKSSLSWNWLHKDVINIKSDVERIVWWSFYEKDSSFELFVNCSLKYLSKGLIKPNEIKYMGERIHLLYNIIRDRKILFILDGVERLLRYYSRLDAPYLFEHQGEGLGDNYQRSFVDIQCCNFFQSLSQKGLKSKVLVTSRLLPYELEDLEACQCYTLKGLSSNEAYCYFHSQGLMWTKQEVSFICEPYGYLPLSLRILTRVILNDPLNPGEIYPDTKEILPKLTRDGKPGRRQIIELAFNSLSIENQSMLCRLSAFRFSVTKLEVFYISLNKNQEYVRCALNALIEIGLLDFEKSNLRYEMHPIIRAYCYKRLKRKNQVHKLLRTFFLNNPKADNEINTIEDATYYIELFYHTVKSELYEKALIFLQKNLYPTPLYFTFGAYQLSIELLLAFFNNNHYQDSLLISGKKNQAWLLIALSMNYSMFGQHRISMYLMNKGIEFAKIANDLERMVIGLGNLVLDQLILGMFDKAKMNLNRRYKICKKLDDKSWLAVNYLIRGRILSYEGKWDESDEELNKALDLYKNFPGYQLFESEVWIYKSLSFILQGKYKESLKHAYQAREQVLKDEVEEYFLWIKWLLGAAYRGVLDINNSKKNLREALILARRMNNVKIEPNILLELSKIKFKENQNHEARKLAYEALKIAKRCQYRIQQADIHLFLSKLELSIENPQKAIDEVELSIKKASCGYLPTLQKAMKLKTLIQESKF